jgi:hypothetical protein
MYYIIETNKGGFEGKEGQSLEDAIQDVVAKLVEYDKGVAEIKYIMNSETEELHSSMAVGFWEDRLEMLVQDNIKNVA